MTKNFCRAVRRRGTVEGFKESQRRKECQSCRWRPPKGLDLLVGPPSHEMLHGHHVLPIACGGEDDETNLVVLCPNCHALAHRLGKMGDSDESRVREWNGPRTAQHLLFELRLLRSPKLWVEYVRAGRQHAQHEADESYRREVREGARRFELSSRPVVA